MKNRKNRRTSQIIHQYQLKFSFFTSLIVLTCTIIYPLIITSFVNALISLIGENSALRESFLEEKNQLILVMIGFEILIVILTFYLTLKHSLKTVGPVMKTISILEKLSQGIPVESVRFRKGDNFQELADYLNRLIDSQTKFESSLRGQVENTVSMLAKLNQRDNITDEEKKDLLHRSLESLREINTMLIK